MSQLAMAIRYWKDGATGGGGGFGNVDPRAEQRALLDQLMGTQRDASLEEVCARVTCDVCLFLLASVPARLDSSRIVRP